MYTRVNTITQGESAFHTYANATVEHDTEAGVVRVTGRSTNGYNSGEQGTFEYPRENVESVVTRD